MRDRVLVILSIAVLVAAAASAAPADKQVSVEQASASITAMSAFATVEQLSSPELGGRLTGTPGYDAAARYMAGQLRKAGLRAPTELPDYLQRFPLTISGVDSATMAILPVKDGDAPQQLAFFKEFLPLLYSGSGDVTAEVVFVGYGITAPELGRDDYAGIDVKDKVVMVVRGAPRDGRNWKDHNSHRARTANAKAHGAAGYIFAEQANANPNGEPIEGLPMVDVTDEVGNSLLVEHKLKLEELRKVLSKGGTASFATGRKVHLAVTGKPARKVEGANVVAVLPGSDPQRAKEYVLIGAHLDHCGDWPTLLPGADDNASGSAVVLEVARAAARLNPRPRRSIVFVLFGGEETGLLGSKQYANNLLPSLGKPVGLYNLDMVGAGTGAYMAAGENFPELFAAFEAAAAKVAPRMALRRGRSEGEARADHGPFMEVGIPAVSIFSSGGKHNDYHGPEDSVYWITPKIMETIGRVVLGAVVNLANK
jgi:hypothetical protein